MKYIVMWFTCVIVLGCQQYNVIELQDIPNDVQKSLQAAVDGGHRPGVVIGLINQNGTFFYSYGVTQFGQQKAVSDQSQFAVGSVTKLFTADLFQQLIADKTLSDSTLVTDIFANATDNSKTRLVQLVSHTSELPRDIPAYVLASDDLSALLTSLTRRTLLPADYAYSSVGMAILGQAIAQKTQSSLATAMQSRIMMPLGMANTDFHANPELVVARHRVTDEIMGGSATPSVAQGAGGLYSTAQDLATFVKYHMTMQQHLGWKVYQDNQFVSYYHGGDGNGNQAFIAFRPDNKVGVVLLSNSTSDDDLQNVALHLIDPSIDLPDFKQPPARRFEDAELLPFVGKYQLVGDESGNTIELLAKNGRLFYNEEDSSGKLIRKSPLYGMDVTSFRLADIPVVITFTRITRTNSKMVYNADLTFDGQKYKMEKVPLY